MCIAWWSVPQVEVVMYDTAGQEDYDRLRPFSYSDTDVMVVCYAIDSPDSLANVLLNWVPEVRYFCGHVPVLLVGCKKDLRDRKDHPLHLQELSTGVCNNLNLNNRLSANSKHAGSQSSHTHTSTQCRPKSDHGGADSEMENSDADVSLARTKGLQDLSAAACKITSRSFDSLDSVLSVMSFPAGEVVVSYDEGLQVARKMAAFGYYECSAKTGEGSTVVLDAVVRAGMEARHKKSTGRFRYKNGRMGR